MYKACTKHLTKNMMGEEVGGVKKSNNANIHVYINVLMYKFKEAC